MANLLLNTAQIDMSDVRNSKVESLTRAFDGNLTPFVFAMYLIETLRLCKRELVPASYAYFYARVFHNVEKTDNPADWNQYLSLYKKEIEIFTASWIAQHLCDLAAGVLHARPNLISAGLQQDVYESIKRCDKDLDQFKRKPVLESIELSLRHMDVREADKTARSYVFTVDEMQSMFADLLIELTRPIQDEKDLMMRTSPDTVWYATTVLSIIYRIFSKGSTPYWYEWDRMYKSPNQQAQRMMEVLSTIPVRTPEAVLCLTGHEKFSGKSIEMPTEIGGVVDRYLTMLFEM